MLERGASGSVMGFAVPGEHARRIAIALIQGQLALGFIDLPSRTASVARGLGGTLGVTTLVERVHLDRINRSNNPASDCVAAGNHGFCVSPGLGDIRGRARLYCDGLIGRVLFLGQRRGRGHVADQVLDDVAMRAFRARLLRAAVAASLFSGMQPGVRLYLR